jgi:hypothetical protein
MRPSATLTSGTTQSARAFTTPAPTWSRQIAARDRNRNRSRDKNKSRDRHRPGMEIESETRAEQAQAKLQQGRQPDQASPAWARLETGTETGTGKHGARSGTELDATTKVRSSVGRQVTHTNQYELRNQGSRPGWLNHTLKDGAAGPHACQERRVPDELGNTEFNVPRAGS